MMLKPLLTNQNNYIIAVSKPYARLSQKILPQPAFTQGEENEKKEQPPYLHW